MIEFTKIKHDSNGNPRYVCSYLHLLTNEEQLQPIYNFYTGRQIRPTKYEIAVKRANKIGGRKYHTKLFGGGIVFQSYSLSDTERDILRIVAKEAGGKINRIEELKEMKQEYILNESWIPEDQSPSWGDVAEANTKAESKWAETEEGKELKSLLGDEGDS